MSANRLGIAVKSQSVLFFLFQKQKRPSTENGWAKEEPNSKAISSSTESAKEASTADCRLCGTRLLGD